MDGAGPHAVGDRCLTTDASAALNRPSSPRSRTSIHPSARHPRRPTDHRLDRRRRTSLRSTKARSHGHDPARLHRPRDRRAAGADVRPPGARGGPGGSGQAPATPRTPVGDPTTRSVPEARPHRALVSRPTRSPMPMRPSRSEGHGRSVRSSTRPSAFLAVRARGRVRVAPASRCTGRRRLVVSPIAAQATRGSGSLFAQRSLIETPAKPSSRPGSTRGRCSQRSSGAYGSVRPCHCSLLARRVAPRDPEDRSRTPCSVEPSGARARFCWRPQATLARPDTIPRLRARASVPVQLLELHDADPRLAGSGRSAPGRTVQSAGPAAWDSDGTSAIAPRFRRSPGRESCGWIVGFRPRASRHSAQSFRRSTSGSRPDAPSSRDGAPDVWMHGLRWVRRTVWTALDDRDDHARTAEARPAGDEVTGGHLLHRRAAAADGTVATMLPKQLSTDV